MLKKHLTAKEMKESAIKLTQNWLKMHNSKNKELETELVKLFYEQIKEEEKVEVLGSCDLNASKKAAEIAERYFLKAKEINKKYGVK